MEKHSLLQSNASLDQETCSTRTVTKYTAMGQVNQGKLHQLLCSAFAKEPTPAFYARPVDALFVAGDYRGAAIVEEEPSYAYLSKFAVSLTDRNAGVGGTLWTAVTSIYPKLVWRCRIGNPVEPWYEARCTGFHHNRCWTVFWIGLASEDMYAAIRRACHAPEDFLPPPFLD